MTKNKIDSAVKTLVDEHGDRVVVDCIDQDEKTSYRKITFKEYAVALNPCCRADIKRLEELLAKTVEKPIEVRDHYIHNTPEDKARRLKNARMTLALGAAMAQQTLGPYLPSLKRIWG